MSSHQKTALRTLERLFPGMGWRPLWMTLISVLCLITYFHYGSLRSSPQWFVDASREFWGIEALRFHLHGWSHLSALVLLMIVPLMLCRLAGIRALDLGLSVKAAKREFRLVLGMWAVFVPVIWLVSETEAFTRVYPRLSGAESDIGLFVAYESFYLVKWVAWEFFFRGFMLFGFKKDFGNRAVLISTIPFVLMHFGKPQAEVYASLAAGFILCWIALRSRSIWPGVLLHWLVA
ncbi:MAG: CPBP family intramembrane metalloprotease, partial [Deltaproteobacteria bacterium]|nr:CPBP family intramembrane metalloprotease [Deltaproteobacteria bacterium]